MRYIVILLISAIIIYGFFIEPNVIKITNIEYTSSKIEDSLNNFTIVHISDLHIKDYGVKEQFVVKSLITIKPNMVVFTGDFIDDKKYLETLNQFLSAFRLSYEGPAFAVLGNWDYESSANAIEKLLNDYNITLLKNENTYYTFNSSSFYVIGVDDPITGHDDLDSALFRVNLNKFTLVLSHAPDIVTKFSSNLKFDLVLCGHTHGGQIGVPFISKKLAPTTTEYIKGLYNTQFGTIYVNRGIGTSVFKFRFLCPPELTVIKLKSEK
ncbi:metallophosphoesterase [Caldisericum exile]|uniref:Hydrolase n=1 Tax=Caldisericum exile (strain DSM 21853 / NBRC 104410 / AZM16c01) TaxID=511051 RepID=A0A7U6GE72_CALEA|nr:metallophosphoesterase [Caldisericum exile]BAL80741.1 putative hydrolase [Caldisericum exile AZM16c01]